jgi:hypothetical protein
VVSVQIQGAAVLPPVDRRQYLTNRGLYRIQGRLERVAEENYILRLPEIETRTINLHLESRD